MFVWMISPEPLKLLHPHLEWWCIIMWQSAVRKDWCANFKVKVTMRVYIIQIWLFPLYLWNWSFCNQPWLEGTSLISWSILWENWIAVLRSQQRFKMSVNVCLDNITWTTEPLVARLGMVVYHYERECHSECRFINSEAKVTWKQKVLHSPDLCHIHMQPSPRSRELVFISEEDPVPVPMTPVNTVLCPWQMVQVVLNC